MDSFGYSILTGITQTMARGVRTIYGPLMESFSGIALTITAIWVVLVGYMFLKGKLREAGTDAMISAVLLSIIAGIIFTPRVFGSWIYDPITSTVTELCAFLVAPSGGGGLPALFVTLDERFSEVFGYIEAISDNADMWNITPLFFSAVLALMFGVLYLIFIVFMATGFFGMNVMLVFGGIFMFFAAFKGTRFLFASWLRTLANYALIPIFTALVMTFTLAGIQSAFADLAAQETTDLWSMEVANAMIVGGLGIFFHWNAPQLAAAITGGQPSGLSIVPIATGLMGGAASRAVGATGIGRGLQRLGQLRDAAYRKAGGAALGAVAGGGARAYSALRGVFKK